MATEPLLSIGQAYIESDKVLRMEFKPMPAVVVDYHFNRMQEVVLELLSRIMAQVIGPVRITGLGVTVGGGYVTLAAGSLLSDLFYVNLGSATTFTQVASDYVVYLQITTMRYDYTTDPTDIEVAIPGTGQTLEGANEYRYTVTATYAASLPTTIAGTGASGTFTRTSGTWTANDQLDKLVKCYDADGNLYGPFHVTSNTTTALSFLGDATGATSVLTDHCVQLAAVASDGTVTTSLASTPGLLEALAHAQNTDLYTTASKFYIGGASGTGLRALTTADISNLTSPTSVTVLENPINFQAQFVVPGSIGTIATDFAQVNTATYPVLDTNWGIDGSGSYSSSVWTVAAGHDGPALTANELVNYLLQTSNNEVYPITASDATAAAGDTFTVTVTVASGQASPNSGTFTIRTNALSYQVILIPYATGGIALDSSKARTWNVVPTTADSIPTELRIGENVGSPGQKFQCQLVAINNALTTGSTRTTAVVDPLYYGTVSTSAVNMGTISAAENVGNVVFSWSQPSGFDTSTMQYQLCWTSDGTTPSFAIGGEVVNTTALKYQVNGSPGNVARISVEVIDMGGQILGTPSSASGTIKGQTVSTNPTVYSISGQADYTSLQTLSDGTSCVVLDQQALAALTNAYVSAISLRVNFWTGFSAADVKLRVYPSGSPASGVSGTDISSSSGGLEVDNFTGTLMDSPPYDIAIELISGTFTTLGYSIGVAYTTAL